jgi:quercetin dioxygenase-like cupin family protein
MYPMPTETTPLETVPVETIAERDGWYYRTICLAQPGTVVPQHVHDHDHETRVESGAARGWQDGEWIGDKAAGQSFHIPAHRTHLFQAIAPDTRLTCVHNIESALSLKRKGF